MIIFTIIFGIFFPFIDVIIRHGFKFKLRFIRNSFLDFKFIKIFIKVLCEELFYRYLIWKICNPNIILFFIISSILFLLTHIIKKEARNSYSIFELLRFNLFASFLFIVTKNIIYPIIFHFLRNFIIDKMILNKNNFYLF